MSVDTGTATDLPRAMAIAQQQTPASQAALAAEAAAAPAAPAAPIVPAVPAKKYAGLINRLRGITQNERNARTAKAAEAKAAKNAAAAALPVKKYAGPINKLRGITQNKRNAIVAKAAEAKAAKNAAAAEAKAAKNAAAAALPVKEYASRLNQIRGITKNKRNAIVAKAAEAKAAKNAAAAEAKAAKNAAAAALPVKEYASRLNQIRGITSNRRNEINRNKKTLKNSKAKGKSNFEDARKEEARRLEPYKTFLKTFNELSKKSSVDKTDIQRLFSEVSAIDTIDNIQSFDFKKLVDTKFPTDILEVFFKKIDENDINLSKQPGKLYGNRNIYEEIIKFIESKIAAKGVSDKDKNQYKGKIALLKLFSPNPSERAAAKLVTNAQVVSGPISTEIPAAAPLPLVSDTAPLSKIILSQPPPPPPDAINPPPPAPQVPVPAPAPAPAPAPVPVPAPAPQVPAPAPAPVFQSKYDSYEPPEENVPSAPSAPNVPVETLPAAKPKSLRNRFTPYLTGTPRTNSNPSYTEFLNLFNSLQKKPNLTLTDKAEMQKTVNNIQTIGPVEISKLDFKKFIDKFDASIIGPFVEKITSSGTDLKNIENGTIFKGIRNIYADILKYIDSKIKSEPDATKGKYRVVKQIFEKYETDMYGASKTSSKWIRRVDASNGAQYFYNPETQVSKWQLNAGDVEGPPAVISDIDVDTWLRAKTANTAASINPKHAALRHAISCMRGTAKRAIAKGGRRKNKSRKNRR